MASGPDGSYPPTTTTTVPPPLLINGFGVVVTETYFIGQNVQFPEACGFEPDSFATLTFNGMPEGRIPVGSSGCITITLAVTDPHVSIDGGPLLPARYNGNNITVVGTQPNTASITYYFNFNIKQNSSSTTTTVPTSANNSGSSSSSSGSLAFTGADVAGMVAGGVVLLLGGAALVMLTRRRDRRHQQPSSTS